MHEPALVDAADLERSLDWVRARAAGSTEGVFGPASAIWQVDREALVFLGAGRALLLQLAHPWVATAIAEHSSVLQDPIGRFHRTFEIVFTLVFGSLDEALRMSRHLHRRHAAIAGMLPTTLGRYAEGSSYRANEVSALMWVHATLVDTALLAYELVLPPLGAETRERYYADSQGSGKNLGRYAASWIACWPRPRRPSSTAALTWSTRCAPRGDQRICLRLFMRALTRWLTVPSAREVEIGLPAR